MGKAVIIFTYGILLFLMVRPQSQGPTLVTNAGNALSDVIKAGTGGGAWETVPRGQLRGGEGAGSSDSPNPQPALLGRRARALSGPVTAQAAGNSVVTSDTRGGARTAAFPARMSGGRTQDTSFGGDVASTPDQLGLPRAAYGGGWADGRLTFRERFVQVMFRHSKRGSKESHSGIPNPQAHGPPLPEYLMDNRTLSWQIGQDKTTQEDNPGPFAVTSTEHPQAAPNAWPVPAMNVQAIERKPYPLGTQNGVPWTTKVWGGTPGLTRAYGGRGTTARR